jgi:hypothetical protein
MSACCKRCCSLAFDDKKDRVESLLVDLEDLLWKLTMISKAAVKVKIMSLLYQKPLQQHQYMQTHLSQAFLPASLSSKYSISFSTVTQTNPHLFEKAKHPSLPSIPTLPPSSPFPSISNPSSTSSAITPTASSSFSPINLQKSTAASVCPALSLTPPTFALSGTTCPGLLKSLFPFDPSANHRHVSARSCAEIPVVTSSLAASTVMVYAVPLGSSFSSTICGRDRAAARTGRRGAHRYPEVWRTRKAALAGVRWRAEMIRSPSFSRDSESRTTMGSPRAGVGRVSLRGSCFYGS